MPHTYLVDVGKIIDDLSADDDLVLEERLVLLAMVIQYAEEVSKQLEGKLAGEKADQNN